MVKILEVRYSADGWTYVITEFGNLRMTSSLLIRLGWRVGDCINLMAQSR